MLILHAVVLHLAQPLIWRLKKAVYGLLKGGAKLAFDKERFELLLYGFSRKKKQILLSPLSGGRGLQMEVAMMLEVVRLKAHHLQHHLDLHLEVHFLQTMEIIEAVSSF